METELHPEHDAELLTLDELTERTGVSARNVRFYASRGLVPAPVRRGRSGYYGPDHVARLELVRELQGHGFTLSAIEKYVERIPDTATPSDIARHLSLLAPVTGDRDVDVPGGLSGMGISPEAAQAVAEVYAEHGRQVAEELSEIVRTKVWPQFREAGYTAEQLREFIHRLKPLTIAGLVTAYEQAIDDSQASYDAKRPQVCLDEATYRGMRTVHRACASLYIQSGCYGGKNDRACGSIYHPLHTQAACPLEFSIA